MIRIKFNKRTGELGVELNLNKASALNLSQVKYIKDKVIPSCIGAIEEVVTKKENTEKLLNCHNNEKNK